MQKHNFKNYQSKNALERKNIGRKILLEKASSPRVSRKLARNFKLS